MVRTSQIYFNLLRSEEEQEKGPHHGKNFWIKLNDLTYDFLFCSSSNRRKKSKYRVGEDLINEHKVSQNGGDSILDDRKKKKGWTAWMKHEHLCA